MSYVDRIIDKFGGQRRMADLTGHPLSTIHSWKKARSIPDKHKAAVLNAGRRAGLDLTEAEFFPDVVPRPQPPAFAGSEDAVGEPCAQNMEGLAE